jgi:hypothetical protein
VTELVAPWLAVLEDKGLNTVVRKKNVYSIYSFFVWDFDPGSLENINLKSLRIRSFDLTISGGHTMHAMVRV